MINKTNKLLSATLAGSAAMAMGWATPSYAIDVLGNLNLTQFDQGTVLNTTAGASGETGQEKALLFTTPSSPNWTLDSITMNMLALESADTYNITLRSDNSGDPSTTSLANFNSVISPALTNGIRKNHTFTGGSSYSLTPNTSYWVVISGGNFTWMADDTSTNANNTPTAKNSSGFTFSRYEIKNFGGNTWSTSSIRNGFNLNATQDTASVPFDFSATPGLFLVGAIWGANKIRRNLANRNNLLES